MELKFNYEVAVSRHRTEVTISWGKQNGITLKTERTRFTVISKSGEQVGRTEAVLPNLMIRWNALYMDIQTATRGR
ncbi:hypothetical protein [Peribacillus kribbensis]|uniref:hypothetical protein n=1 Tax=Peribacillus kribbensis TaxID=356658 RepID=UPI0012DF2480|nr:hypothetical protein [Peribacillus kribbensis]